METILLEIINELRETGQVDDKRLAKIIHGHNRNLSNEQHYSKKKLLPYYLKTKKDDPKRWDSWNLDQAIEKQLLQVLQIKPRRTASGVATITVITKPWKCSNNCLYCPNDLRMPKSYLSDEPACQRAEQNYFDPYLQVASRLYSLTQMGHDTDKIELIILGGTWSDYPKEYQIWFVTELFRALNGGNDAERSSKKRRQFYEDKGCSNSKESLRKFVEEIQREVNSGSLTYNQAVEQLYLNNEVWRSIAREQTSDLNELTRQHTLNETAQHRVVGLVIETRPDRVTRDNLMLIRRLGCTKVQMGIQSLDPTILKLNDRSISLDKIHEAFELLRLFGFKIHAHFMLNLYGSSPENDKREYKQFVTQREYLPDEVKLYPCSLVGGTKLCTHYADKTWRPYSEEELLDILEADTLATPPFIRISRMIRDISAHDILAGNKKTNLRQLVENKIGKTDESISEIRHREINTSETDVNQLTLEILPYETTVTNEYFLQWVTAENKIAGFLRLSLPKIDYMLREQMLHQVPQDQSPQLQALEHQPLQHQALLPIGPYEAMIREVHIYGKVAKLHKAGEGAQHLGLGKRLIEAACESAKDQGYKKINVISSVGTREYYRNLGFEDKGLYQQKKLS